MFKFVTRSFNPVIRAARPSAVVRFTPISAFHITSTRLYEVKRDEKFVPREKALERITEVIKGIQAANTSTEINRKTEFSKDLGLDSLDTVELLIAVEEDFDIEIPDDIADEMKTVGDLIDYVSSDIYAAQENGVIQ